MDEQVDQETDVECKQLIFNKRNNVTIFLFPMGLEPKKIFLVVSFI